VFYPTDDVESDFKQIEDFYSKITAADPSKYNPKLQKPEAEVEPSSAS
jgi:hypothetical protein